MSSVPTYSVALVTGGVQGIGRVSKEDEIKGTMEQIVAKLGRLDVGCY